jgi:hypothetical protein
MMDLYLQLPTCHHDTLHILIIKQRDNFPFFGIKEADQRGFVIPVRFGLADP